MLKHLPCSGMDFLLHIFNLFGTLHSFPSIWKTSSIIPIHKIRKPLDSPASFRPISLTSCVSKLFEGVILSRLLFFLESNSIVSSCQASFCPGRSTLDQILFLSQSISDGFNKPRPGSQAILSTIDFSKAFDSVWHLALYHKLILAGLPSWSRPHKERWFEYWCLPLNPSKCEASFFSVDPRQANLQPNLHLFNSCLCFNATPTFLGVTFDRTLFFSKHASLLKAKFFPALKALRCISALSWGPFEESLFCINLLFGPILTYTLPGWFPLLSIINFTKLNASTKRLVAPSPAASRPPLSHFFSLRLLYLPFKSP